EFRSVFRAPSRKFKIQAIPNVFSHWKSYEHGFVKKRYGHKLCAKSSFDRFFMHRLENSKYWPFPVYSAMGSRTSMVLRKNATVINFTQSRVSIDFSCTVSKIQNSSHSQAIGSRTNMVFQKKCYAHKLCAKSSFNQFFIYRLENSKSQAIPNVFALRKSYELSFVKQHDGYKLCAKSHAKSSFDRFFVHRLGNSKFWPFPTY
ncbi:hypothetical protein BHE74_00030787, partial [Ensete ventricosum]